MHFYDRFVFHRKGFQALLRISTKCLLKMLPVFRLSFWMKYRVWRELGHEWGSKLNSVWRRKIKVKSNPPYTIWKALVEIVNLPNSPYISDRLSFKQIEFSSPYFQMHHDWISMVHKLDKNQNEPKCTKILKSNTLYKGVICSTQ